MNVADLADSEALATLIVNKPQADIKAAADAV